MDKTQPQVIEQACSSLTFPAVPVFVLHYLNPDYTSKHIQTKLDISPATYYRCLALIRRSPMAKYLGVAEEPEPEPSALPEPKRLGVCALTQSLTFTDTASH